MTLVEQKQFLQRVRQDCPELAASVSAQVAQGEQRLATEPRAKPVFNSNSLPRSRPLKETSWGLSDHDLSVLSDADIGNRANLEPHKSEILRAAQSGSSLAQYLVGLSYYLDKSNTSNWATSALWFSAAADHSFPRAQYSLGLMAKHGEGQPQNSAAALDWFNKAAERGLAVAQLEVCSALVESKKDDASAAKWCEAAAQQGLTSAQVPLGWMYASGRGVGQDFQRAMDLFRQADNEGNASAAAGIGDLYSLGHGVSADSVQAVQWYLKGSLNGDAAAQDRLADAYLRGDGVAQDYQKALAWYHTSAVQDNEDAEFALGDLFSKGTSKTPIANNRDEAVGWYRKALAHGNDAALSRITDLCESVSLEVVPEGCVYWYGRAAQNEKDKQSLYELGVIYQKGASKNDLPPDTAPNTQKALGYLNEAADAGNGSAISRLACTYHEGWGVPKDIKLADKYASRLSYAPYDDGWFGRDSCNFDWPY